MEYTGISRFPVGSGLNTEAAYDIPAKRCCCYGVSSTARDPIARASVGGASKFKGITSHLIAAGAMGDVHTRGIVPVESDGSGTIAAGDDLTFSTTADATEGRVKKWNPATGANAPVIGKAQNAVAATAGLIVMVELGAAGAQSQGA